MSKDGMDLLAACVAANVESAAYTTNLLLAANDRDIASLAETVVLLDQILADATVIDRATEMRLASLAGRIDNAYRHHERTKDTS